MIWVAHATSQRSPEFEDHMPYSNRGMEDLLKLNEIARDAFHKLKKAVMSAAILAYPDPDKEYLLKNGASKLTLGVVLSQKQADGRYHAVTFGS